MRLVNNNNNTGRRAVR